MFDTLLGSGLGRGNFSRVVYPWIIGWFANNSSGHAEGGMPNDHRANDAATSLQNPTETASRQDYCFSLTRAAPSYLMTWLVANSSLPVAISPSSFGPLSTHRVPPVLALYRGPEFRLLRSYLLRPSTGLHATRDPSTSTSSPFHVPDSGQAPPSWIHSQMLVPLSMMLADSFQPPPPQPIADGRYHRRPYFLWMGRGTLDFPRRSLVS